MTATIDSLFAAAMSLDVETRKDLAERLWDTVQSHDDSVFPEEMWAEIGNRIASSDAGLVKHIPGDVALAQIRAEFGMPPGS